MTDTAMFLRPDAIVEPLVDRWHAWAHLLSPATGAMLVANAHAKLLKAFAAAPQVHAGALRNRAMRGGPYVELEASRVPAVRALLEQTTREQAHLLELAGALKALDDLLAEEARGGSLEALYARVPEPLRGLVELVYDLADNPSARPLEGMLFQTRYHDPRRQGVRLTLSGPDARPYALSTPRLGQPGDLFVQVPFSSAELDELYAARSEPRPLGVLARSLGLGDDGAEQLRPFFTAGAPAPRAAASGVPTARSFGHAGLLLEADGASVLVDPIVGVSSPGGPPRPTFADLPASIDAVLITSGRPDHLIMETLLELRRRAKKILVPRSGGTLADPSLRLVLEHAGFSNVVEVGELETVAIAGVSVTALPSLGRHGDLDVRSKAGFFVRLGGRGVALLPGANDVEPRLYDRVASLLGVADALFVGTSCEGAPMSWLYGALFTRPIARKNDLARRLDGSDAARALALVERFQARRVLVHGMGLEPWLGHVVASAPAPGSRPLLEAEKLVAACRERGVPADLVDARTSAGIAL